jgi:hypothetical protein
MASPWEKYQNTATAEKSASKPWEKYSGSEKSTDEPTFGKKAFEFIEPTAEALGTAGGAALGSFAGPLGTVGGAGLGYGMTKEALRLGKQALGYEKPRQGMARVAEPVQNILTGATYEAGGRALPEVLKTVGTGARGLVDALRTPKSAKIAGQALGDNLPKAREILKQASSDLSASQALSTIDPKTGEAVLNAPTAQALLKRAEARNPEFFTDLFGKQEGQRLKTLQAAASGANQTEARVAQEQLKEELNKTLIPKLKIELEAANTAGRVKPKLSSEASRMESAAASKVEDVRRMQGAKERATEKAPMFAPSYMGESRAGMPAPYRELPSQFATQYTYPGELAKRADEFMNQAANASLRFGDAARFARAAEDSLAAYGLKPLESNSIVNAIVSKAKDPSIAGNKDLERALIRVGGDIQKWTKNGGVIDAIALDAIRKNSVNQVAKDLFKDDVRAQKRFAAQVIESIRPTIIDAIESAGGTGYRQYLQDYAQGSRAIAEKKMNAELLNMYKTNPKQFKSLVEGDNPEQIEKIFGPGNYSVFKELSGDLQNKLGKIARDIGGAEAAKTQSEAGQQRLADILRTNIGPFSKAVQSVVGYKAGVPAEIVTQLQGRISKNALKELTEAAKSAKNLEDLLSKLPTETRSEIEKQLTPSPVAGGIAAGIDQQRKRK